MRKRFSSALVWAAAVGLAGGVAGIVLSAASLRAVLPAVRQLHTVPTLSSVQALPRTELVLVTEEARELLRQDRPWAAWLLLRNRVRSPDEVSPAAVMAAAQAATGWNAWGEVRALLRGREWLATESDGIGWFLLARAEEEARNEDRAAAAYQRYLEVGSAPAAQRGIAATRLAGLLAKQGRYGAAAHAYGAAAGALPALADWLGVLRAEQMVAAGDAVGAIPVARNTPGAPAPVRARTAKLETAAWLAMGDTALALQRLEEDLRALAAQGAAPAMAELALRRASLLSAVGRTGEARELLRSTAWETSIPAPARMDAANRLGELAGSTTAAEEIARAAAYEAGGKPGLAARAIRSALDKGFADDPQLALRRGMLLYEERDFGPARAVLNAAAARLSDPEQIGTAELHAARALYRGGDKAVALAEFRQIVAQRSGTAAAGSAMFLLGDANPDLNAAIAWYRRAADVRHSPHAREALFRLGDRSLKADNRAAALAAWRQYIERFPRGEETAAVAYRAGRIQYAAGEAEAANRLYEAAIAADPLSYYAMRAGDRLRTDPIAGVLRNAAPWVGLASDPVAATATLERLALLQQTGLDEAWQEELDAAIRRLEDRPVALLALAEGLRDQGHSVRAIRLGRALLDRRNGEWDARLLRVVFPFPFRNVIEAEAERQGISPMLLAGLIRQESSFRPDARSWVGATGLSQIMPATGKWLGRNIPDYTERHLTVPEANVRMGAAYLAELLRRYDGEADLALAGYNAGPGRADRWRRELGRGDIDQWREKIPFNETRHYVKVVLRNADVYRSLYGTP